MRVPVSRSRPLRGRGGVPVADRAAVGVLGLEGECVFGVADRRGAGAVPARTWPLREGAPVASSSARIFLAVSDGWAKA